MAKRKRYLGMSKRQQRLFLKKVMTKVYQSDIHYRHSGPAMGKTSPINPDIFLNP
jgi:hypothetical protein